VLSIKYNINGIIISNVYQFAFGYIAFMAYVKLIDRKWFWIIFLLFTTYIIFAKSIISGVVPASAVAFLMLYKRNTNVPVLNFLGNISYSLYLMHIPISAIVIRTLSGSLKNAGLLFLVCLILSILIAYIFYLLIERPALNLSKRINLRKG
jgi:peptidoglycan/LPS O-acetylase OafA/YrhL